MTRFITFGEIMARLAPPGFLRLAQTLPGRLDWTFAGAEANVAASLAILGADAALVTALPNNPLTDACVSTLRGLGIDTSYVLRRDVGRLGLYFVETGANQRPSRVIYDREGSSISLTPPGSYDWESIFARADWLHITGITPALSKHASDATLEAASRAKASGLTVSCDLNFRAKLWRWDESAEPQQLARRVMSRLLPHVDVLIANEADCGDVLDIHAGQSDVTAGRIEVDAYPKLARQVVDKFPNLQMVATTLRESVSASHNNWGAMLYDAADKQAYFAPQHNNKYRPYEIRNIVDRVGGGDAFAAGLLFSINCDAYAGPQQAVHFAAAASCLAHSIVGDFNFSNREEIDALAAGSASGRVVR